MVVKSELAIWIVDAFADKPFAGNPAGVCLLDKFPTDQWMQSVAAEMNLSETAFVVPTDQPDSYLLRWFTPLTEVDLCGHATLASAYTLFDQAKVGADQTVRFQTLSGELTCHQSEDRLTLDFPATPATNDVDTDSRKQIFDALDIVDGEVMRTKFDLVVVCKDAATIDSLKPDFNRLREIETRGVIVTSACRRDGIDFLSRFFAPRCGINEDPVTGSAHCCLAPLWADRLGKQSLVGYQASRRGGTVHCQVIGDRVQLSGHAVTIMTGSLHVPIDTGVD